MVSDEEGFVYFIDRLGDSYRWKGENISSTQVEEILSKICNYADVAVYGAGWRGSPGPGRPRCPATRAAARVRGRRRDHSGRGARR